MKWIQILHLLVSFFNTLYNLSYQRGVGILGMDDLNMVLLVKMSEVSITRLRKISEVTILFFSLICI